MTRSLKLLSQASVALILMAGMGAVQAAPVTYNYTISGDVLVGDETFGFNAWDLTAGDVITASGSFTADLGSIGSETGTVVFGLGDTMTIDLLGGQFLTEADSTIGVQLSFSGGSLTDFSFLNGTDFNSNFTSFDDFVDGTMFGEWDTSVSLTAVPVPAAVWLFGSGLVAMFGMARRKKTV